MMIGERIWGQDFIDSLKRPHSDPEIRKMESEMSELILQVYANSFRKPKYEEIFDPLPAYYKRIKV